jgi:hypothetical protein
MSVVTSLALRLERVRALPVVLDILIGSHIPYELQLRVDRNAIRKDVLAAISSAGLLGMEEDDRDAANLHVNSVLDTGDAYEATKGWHFRCLWCPHYFVSRIKADGIERMQKHYDFICGQDAVAVHK